MGITGAQACGSSDKRQSFLEAHVTVYRADETVVFESEPLDASPDIWYESSESFGIVEGTDKCRIELGVATAEPTPIAFNYLDLDGRSQQIVLQPGTALFVNGICGSAAVSPTTPATLPVTIFDTALAAGTHLGNVQDQILSSSTPAICETNFFNCFTFGNGVESYKIRDSAIGKPFALGNRVTSTQANEVEQVNRFADITYSGVYSDESNVNRLNEFNRGLLNFKPLEESFGPVEILFGRETDVLTLQEDKISYVLAGKNLLSDAAGGSTLTSVPQVLGTQIARIEEFGISNNPESFAQWGPDKYFTDAKRGAVLKLTGASGPSDSLEVISQNGMRTWFRDLFLVSMNKQKLGGFDPYMNEYVITANQQNLPAQIECVDCDVSQTIIVTPETPYNRCFELGAAIGETIMGWGASTINQGDVLDYDVIITYNGNVTQILGSSSGTGTLIFQKDTINVTEVTIQIISRVPMNINFTVGCPLSETISIVEVCVTSPNEEGLQVHNQHRFVDGTYTSPLTSNQVKFGTDIGSPVVSYYDVTTGPQGVGAIPPNGASMTLTFNKLSGDSATFDTATNDFKFLRSSTNYPNTQASIATLLAAATSMTTDTGGAPNIYTGTFTVPNGSNGDFLYLIYDYRKPNNVNLCFGADLESSCCGC